MASEPTETDRELSEDEGLSLLDADEMLAAGDSGCGVLRRRLAAERRTVRELRAVLSGRTMYDAAAVEREAILALIEDEHRSGWWRNRIAPHLIVGREVLGSLAAKIRARGDDGGAHE